MKKSPSELDDSIDVPADLQAGLDQQKAQLAWTKLQEQNRYTDQTIAGPRHKFYCVKDDEDIRQTHFSISVLQPNSDPNKIDPTFGFTLIRTRKGTFKVIPPGITYEGEEFELKAGEINSMIAEIASGTREVKEETVVDGIKRGTRRKVAKIK